MRKFGFLGVILALCLAFTSFASCTKGPAEHDHVYGEGEVTSEATCYREGVMTFHCTVEGCKQTKTEAIEMTEHKWDNGTVTTDPKCNAEGVRTYKCTNDGCTAERTEPIGKGEHRWDEGRIEKLPGFISEGERVFTCADCGTERRETIEAHADYIEQFRAEGTENNGWVYGYAEAYPAEGGADYVEINAPEEGVWKVEGVEISAGNVAVNGKCAVVGYRFENGLPHSTQAKANVSFKGKEAATRMNARLVLAGADGSVKSSIEISGDESEWEYASENAMDVEVGDIIYIALSSDAGAEGELTFTVYAPCIHVFDNGTVTLVPKCNAEGTKEYKCLNCDVTYTESVDKIPHTWDGGTVTLPATKDNEGVMTYECTECHEKKTEEIPRLSSETFEGADFAADFSTKSQADWKYGYTDDYDFDKNTFTFHAINGTNGDAWTEGDIEIKSGWLRNEQDGRNAVVRYIMPETRNVKISLNFNGSDSVTRIIIRLTVTAPNGENKSYDFIYNETSSITFEKELTVEKGHAVSAIFFNEGTAGYFHGSFNMTLTATDEGDKSMTELANFQDDFTTEAGGKWLYGCAENYNFDDNSFTFRALNAGEFGWESGDGIDIRKDWVRSEKDGSDLAVGYKIPAGVTSVDVDITFAHAPDSEKDGPSPTRISARINVAKADGTHYADFIETGKDQADWQEKRTVAVSEGDVVYVILFKESQAWPQGVLQVVISGETAPATFGGANFFDDFSLEKGGDWVYGYATDFNFGHGDFTFHEIDADSDGWNSKDGIQIKRDWVCSEKKDADLAVGYKIHGYSGSVKVAIDFAHAPASETDGVSPTRISARIVLARADGTFEEIFINMGEADWQAERDVNVSDGDTIYVILFKESRDWPQGKLQIVLS